MAIGNVRGTIMTAMELYIFVNLYNTTTKIIQPCWMLKLHESLDFMLPNHFPRNIQVPSDFSQCPVTLAIKSISLPDH